MPRRPKSVPDTNQLSLLDTPEPLTPEEQAQQDAQVRAEAQVAWAEASGDDIPYWTAAA